MWLKTQITKLLHIYHIVYIYHRKAVSRRHSYHNSATYYWCVIMLCCAHVCLLLFYGVPCVCILACSMVRIVSLVSDTGFGSSWGKLSVCNILQKARQKSVPIISYQLNCQYFLQIQCHKMKSLHANMDIFGVLKVWHNKVAWHRFGREMISFCIWYRTHNDYVTILEKNLALGLLFFQTS